VDSNFFWSYSFRLPLEGEGRGTGREEKGRVRKGRKVGQRGGEGEGREGETTGGKGREKGEERRGLR
jgi:hypothetical protein